MRTQLSKRYGLIVCAERTSRLQGGFSRAEVVGLLAIVTLLVVVGFPVLANSRSRAERIQCANNLRQIGAAMQVWGNDFSDLPPWDVPSSVPGGAPGSGPGTQMHPLSVNVWLHFSWISNQLTSPRVLLCPSDTGRLARDFSNNPNGGYLHPNYRNQATSYLITHTINSLPGNLMLADRNLEGDRTTTTCSRFPVVEPVRVFPLSANFRWGTNLHDGAGNMLRFDGAVIQNSTEQLRADFANPPVLDGQSGLHLLKPR